MPYVYPNQMKVDDPGLPNSRNNSVIHLTKCARFNMRHGTYHPCTVKSLFLDSQSMTDKLNDTDNSLSI